MKTIRKIKIWLIGIAIFFGVLMLTPSCQLLLYLTEDYEQVDDNNSNQNSDNQSDTSKGKKQTGG